MMYTLLLLSSAFAGEVVFDVKVPARIVLDGEVAAEVYREGTLRMPVPDGPHNLVISTEGNPRAYPIEVGKAPVLVLVGRTGVSVGKEEQVAGPVVEGDSSVVFRTMRGDRLMVQVGQQRVVVAPGDGVALALAVGEHPMSVRSADGTLIYARGMLTVTGGNDMVVQLTEGKIPETAGEGISFHAVSH